MPIEFRAKLWTPMREGAKARVGQSAAFAIEPSTDAVKIELPSDFRAAFKSSAKALAQWEAITPKAKAEWVAWVTSAKREETRAARVTKTILRLAKGDKRRGD